MPLLSAGGTENGRLIRIWSVPSSHKLHSGSARRSRVQWGRGDDIPRLQSVRPQGGAWGSGLLCVMDIQVSFGLHRASRYKPTELLQRSQCYRLCMEPRAWEMGRPHFPSSAGRPRKTRPWLRSQCPGCFGLYRASRHKPTELLQRSHGASGMGDGAAAKSPRSGWLANI